MVERNSSTALESSHRPSNRRKYLNIAAIAGFAVCAAVVAIYLTRQGPQVQRSDLLYHKVRKEPLNLNVVERGALESADNRDVICRVRAGNKANSLTIKWVIEDGTLVKQGQQLVEIEDTALQDQWKAQKILLDTARSNMVQSEENYKIVVSQTESEIATAQVNVELAAIDLKKYLEGDYLKEKKDIEGRRLIAQSNVEQQADRVAYTERMVKMKYSSPAQLQAEQSKLQSYEVELAKVVEERRVLEDYTKARQVKDLTGKLEEARRALDRQMKQAKARQAQAESERMTRKSIFDQEQDKFDDIEEQIANCRIFSPQDGLVVYYVSEQSRWGSGSQQSIIAQGEPVKEGQRLMRIPDLRRMVVNTKVHEAMVSRVKGEAWRHIGFTDALRAGMLFNSNPLSRLVSVHALHDVKEKFHDLDHEKIQDGHKAVVRIDAYPDRVLPGHVKSVATVAGQQDWMSADVKTYQTLVAIDESMDGLKPGMSAEVTIQIDSTGEEVIALPLQAIVGGAEMGPKRKCFVKGPDGAAEREIIVGLSNEKMAEVRSGLEVGDEVVLNPKVLMGDKVRVRTGGDSDRSDSPYGNGNGGEGKRKGGGKGKGDMQKGGMPPGMKGGPPTAQSKSQTPAAGSN